MPLGILAEDVVNSCCGLVDEIVSNEVERLGELYASDLLDKPVVDETLPVPIEARIVDEELFLESFGEIELFTSAKFVGESVRQYDLEHLPVMTWKGALCSFRPFATVSVPAEYQDHLGLSPCSVSATTGKPFNGLSIVRRE